MIYMWISILLSAFILHSTFAANPYSSPQFLRSSSSPPQAEHSSPSTSTGSDSSGLQIPLASSSSNLPPSFLPDSIRDFRFNAPVSTTTIPQADQDDSSSSTSYNGEPSIDDLVLSPIVLAVTVDGQVHALKRETGQWLWTLHDDGGVALGGLSPRDQLKRERASLLVGSPLVKAAGRRKSAAAANGAGGGSRQRAAQRSSNDSTTSNSLELASEKRQRGLDVVVEDEFDDEEDEVYVIEPFSGGDIFLFTRSPDGGGSLEKLPLSMQQLVALSPFTFPSDSSRMFVGKKETNLVGVDLRTGRLVGVFGSGAGWCEWDETRQGRVRTEEECDEEISRRPEDLLYMARTEYSLSIFSKSSSALLQTLSYTTYTSSSLGSTLQDQWVRTPDDRYLQPTHDGKLLCFLTGTSGLQWAIEFDHPVVSVFDIALPRNTASADGETAQPLMFEQPHSRLSKTLPRDFDELRSRPEATFIGKIGEDLFAMSKENFPLVALAPPTLSKTSPSPTTSSSTDLEEEDEPEPTSRERCRGLECLVGRHELLRPTSAALDDRIDAPTDRLQIDPAPPSPPVVTTTPISPHLPNRSSDLASTLYRPVKKLSTSKSAAFGTVLLMLLGYLSVRKFWTPKTQGAIERRVRRGLSASSRFLDLRKGSRSKHLDASLPPTPNSTSRPTTPLPIENGDTHHPGDSSSGSGSSLFFADFPPQRPSSPSIAEWNGPLPIPIPSTSTSLNHSPPAISISSPQVSSSNSSPTMMTRTRSTSLSTPPSRDLKELPPIPPPLTEIDDGEGDSDGEMKDVGGVEGAKPKRSRRRRGKKTKKGQKVLVDELGAKDEAEVLEKDLKNLSLAEVDVREDGGIEVSEVGQSEPQVIGGLCVSETILGYGSHGTVVLRGEFQGRAVAVKRLLKDFVTIATHEVALLQESDDHPHVIRYFCKEQRDTFLYIALELCPASLYDLIDQPSAFPDLVRDLDSKRALKQITSGLRHLHRLKIVHRDIKPQNILVSPGKHGTVRMLISDFGLCKKLDMDESSFQQTVNHAAGSFGYRAPEVLRGQVDPNDGGTGTPSNGTADSRLNGNGAGSVGSGIITDPSMRLTRSIDIFSLGCIFYYVLTGGEHPFGGRYEREMNILSGKLSLERLDGLGEEALEVQDLVTRMVATDPRERPSAEAVLLHPFFWNAQKRLLFLCDASDRFEIMERDPPDQTLVSLEKSAHEIVGDDWQKAVDKTLLENLGKYRKYDGKSVRDLLRVLRNKKHHYQDLPDNVRKNLGDLPGGFLSYFTSRFPRLLLHVYDTVAEYLSDEPMFASTFHMADDEH